MIEEDVKDKIDVISVRPDCVSTGLVRNPELSMRVITPENAASSVLRKIGQTSHTHGHWKHEIKCWLDRNRYLNKKLNHHFLTQILKRPVVFPIVN